MLHEEIYRRTCHFLFASNNACTMSTRWMCFVGGSGRCSAFKHCVHVLLYVSDMHFIFYRSFNIACTCLRAATGKLAAKSSKRHLFLTWNQCCYTRSLTIKKIKLSKRCHTGQHFLAVETVLTYFSCSSVWLVSLGLHLHISMFLTTAFLWRSHGPCHLSHKTLKSKFTKKQNKQKKQKLRIAFHWLHSAELVILVFIGSFPLACASFHHIPQTTAKCSVFMVTDFPYWG